MCRIAGIALRVPDPNLANQVQAMTDALAHGGPDDAGLYLEDRLAIGHRRLSIIDLSSAGHQPMSRNQEQLIISYNGEIYNFQTLKKELESVGVVFHTQTDTEVILAGFQEWGVRLFDRLEGIFAFALLDKQAMQLYLVRDHVGVKPLYYFLDQRRLVFASEVKAFRALAPDWREFDSWKILFLAFGSIPFPYTTLENVWQVEPGSYLKVDLNTFDREVVHYATEDAPVPYLDRMHEILKLMHDRIRDAVHKNLISDAPIGVFLSGGIDSSLLTMLADKMHPAVKSVSVNFNEVNFDERVYQNLVVRQIPDTDHSSYLINEEDFWSNLEDVWRAMDQPSIDGVNSYFVSRCARQSGLKVVLSGLGADELFGGYESLNRIQWVRRLRRFPLKRVLADVMGLRNPAFKRLMYLSLPGPVGDYLFLRGIHTPDAIAGLLQISESQVWDVLSRVPSGDVASPHNHEYSTSLESKFYMSNQLLKDADYMSMWHGLELRVPFLDIALIRAVKRVIPSQRSKKGWPKYLLTATTENILPHDIVFRKKAGFTFPFAVWLSLRMDEFRRLIKVTPEVNQLLKEFKAGKVHWSKCWSMAVIHQFKY